MTGVVVQGEAIDASRVRCQAYTIKHDTPLGGRSRIALRPVPGTVVLDPAYDGYFFVGKISASPPEVL